MIIGIGTDIVQMERIKQLYEKHDKSFINRILHPEEIKQLAKKKTTKQIIGFISKRFAGKEAIAKALGTGIGDDISFVDILIENNSKGRPIVKLDTEEFKEYKEYKFNISLSDDYPIAVAFAVITIDTQDK
ncbi:MAG: holo-ACP synthase [Rickettsiaceae bacterium]|nr:holo-ACP synthase [Rickettsiaceae bacterium]